jgi:hypothetical protein
MKMTKSIWLQEITYYLFIVLFAELVLGGGGRLTAFGPISLRMGLFSMALLLTAVHIFVGEKIPIWYQKLLVIFIVVMIISLSIGIWSGAEKKFWWEDVKPLLYFFILPFFSVAVKTQAQVETVVKLIKVSAIAQATIFFCLLLLIHTGVMPFLDFYKPAIETGEFFFRGEITFFFKGFVYLCIGFIFIQFTQKRNRAFWLIFILLAIILSFTRGFLLALALTYASYFFMKGAWWKVITLSTAALAILVIGSDLIGFASEKIDSLKRGEFENTAVAQNATSTSANIAVKVKVPSPNSTLLGDREFSDAGRIDQIREVYDGVTPLSLLIGHGFGIGIPSRQVHMEISYLEIFHKQGILGLLFWGIIVLTLFVKYRAAISSPLSDAFFLSAIFVFFQSLTNQFINNPIGLSMILLTIVVLDLLKKPGSTLADPDVNNKVTIL